MRLVTVNSEFSFWYFFIRKFGKILPVICIVYNPWCDTYELDSNSTYLNAFSNPHIVFKFPSSFHYVKNLGLPCNKGNNSRNTLFISFCLLYRKLNDSQGKRTRHNSSIVFHSVFNPLLESGNPRVDSGLSWASTSNSPRDNAQNSPFTIYLLHYGTTRITWKSGNR